MGVEKVTTMADLLVLKKLKDLTHTRNVLDSSLACIVKSRLLHQRLSLMMK
jgi:hypothetical protein